MSILNCWKWLMNLKDASRPSLSSTPLELCDDVLMDIYLRLPPEVLPRFKCVSKQSFRVITTSFFQKTYRTQKLNQPPLSVGLFYQHAPSKQIGFASTVKDNEKEMMNKRGLKCIDKSLGFLPCQVRILASCHGLILCSITDQTRACYLVCNPVSKQYASLPIIESDHEYFSTGFFVDSKFGHYQVVRICKSAAKNMLTLVQTFSSETGEWRRLQIIVPLAYCLVDPSRAAAEFNGSLYWVNMLGSILAYDVSKEKFRFLDLPDLCAVHSYGYKRDLIKKGYLGESGGYLCYASIHANSLVLWVLKSGVWMMLEKVHLVNAVVDNLEVLEGLDGLKNIYCLPIKPVSFDKFDPHLVYLKLSNWLVAYHCRTGKTAVLNKGCSEKQDIETVCSHVLPQLPFSMEFPRCQNNSQSERLIMHSQ